MAACVLHNFCLIHDDFDDNYFLPDDDIDDGAAVHKTAFIELSISIMTAHIYHHCCVHE